MSLCGNGLNKLMEGLDNCNNCYSNNVILNIMLTLYETNMTFKDFKERKEKILFLPFPSLFYTLVICHLYNALCFGQVKYFVVW